MHVVNICIALLMCMQITKDLNDEYLIMSMISRHVDLTWFPEVYNISGLISSVLHFKSSHYIGPRFHFPRCTRCFLRLEEYHLFSLFAISIFHHEKSFKYVHLLSK